MAVNLEARRVAARARYKLAPDKQKAASMAYCEANREAVRERARAYYVLNRESVLARHRQEAERNRAYREANRAIGLVNRAKRRAKSKGVPCDLTTADIRPAIEAGICELTGIPFYTGQGPRRWNTPSIDRIIPSEGYVRGNVRVVLWCANAMLGEWGIVKVLEIADALRANCSEGQQ